MGVVGEVEWEERLVTTDDGGQKDINMSNISRLHYKLKSKVARERTKLCLRRVGIVLLLYIYYWRRYYVAGGGLKTS